MSMDSRFSLPTTLTVALVCFAQMISKNFGLTSDVLVDSLSEIPLLLR